jgi:signal transduction histidine kinase/ActR/RegA family two-component response regulator
VGGSLDVGVASMAEGRPLEGHPSLKDEVARLRALADAGALLVSALDDEEVVGRLPTIVVRELATICIVDLREGGRRRKGVAAHDSRWAPLAEELALYDLDWSRPYLGSQALLEGRPVLASVVTDELIVSGAQSAAHLELLRRLELRSMMAVPMIGRGGVVGSLTFLSSKPGRVYADDDLTFAREIAHRAAAAVDRARLHQEAQKAIATRENLMAIVSHDLRNPLTTILMTAELLLRTVPNDRRRRDRKHAETIHRSAARMDRLVRDLLDFATVEGGRLVIEPKPHLAKALAQEALEAQEGLAMEKAVQLELVQTAEDALILCDRERIEQVFANLLGNALKFTPRGGRITLSIGRRDGDVCFAVTDRGPGIPRHELPHIFERFWQARGTARLGTGLGLSIAEGIVGLHGGHIWVDSEVGQGSTFSFTCPLAPANARLESREIFPLPTPRAAERASRPTRTILLVDDDADVRHALRPIIEREGYVLKEAENGLAALERLKREGPPDLILLDLEMPVMDGWGFLSERERDAALRAVPVIVISAHRDVARRVAAARACYIQKPFRPESLVQTIERLAADRLPS